MSSISERFHFNKSKVISWVILIWGALSVVFLGGKRRAFGVFIAQLHKEFNETSLTELNWIGDSYSALGYMSTSLSIAVILHFKRRYALFQFIGSLFVLASCVSSAYVPNPHWLFLTHTLIHGIGSSIIISVVGLVINEHFNKKHPYHILATTLVSGGSVAAIFFIRLFAYLIYKYTWQHAFLILGGLYFVVLASGSLVFRRNNEVTEDNEIKRLSCNCEGIKPFQIPLVVLWFIDRIMTSVVTYGILYNLTVYSHRHHTSLVNSTILITLFAGGEGSTYLIGAIITAITKNFFKNKLRYVLLVSSVIMSASLLALAYLKHIILARKILCFIAGFSLGPSITFLFPAGEELTQLPGHIAYPLSLGGMGFGMIISPLLTAKIAEILRYKWFFFAQGCMIFIKVVCLLIIVILLWFYKSRNISLSHSEVAPEYEKLENDVDEDIIQYNTIQSNIKS